MISRRQFMKLSAAGSLAAFVSTRAHFMLRAYGQFTGPQIALPGSALPQFADELPLLGSGMVLATGTNLTINMEEFRADMMPTGFTPIDPVTGLPPVDQNQNPIPYSGTWVWGYQTEDFRTIPADWDPDLGVPAATYINPVVLAWRGTPTEITWVNKLPDTSLTETAWATWTDQTLHWADPKGEMMNHPKVNYSGRVPAVAHLHGGEVPPQLDGGPDAWFLSGTTSSGYTDHGHAYWAGGATALNEAIYNYPNTQEAAPIWFHDHALGITRLNVYAGIAGAYLLLDPDNPWPIDPTRIIPIVIQDRMFDTMGQLYFPAGPPFSPNFDVHPFWVPEFEGDVICVNGKVWPKLTVGNKRYAFWFLNGSNARTYNMSLTDPAGNPGPTIWVIGTDGGLLDAPVPLDPALAVNNSLTMMPGERYLAIIDFTNYSGTWLLKNTAKTPFPAGVAPNGRTTGRIMMFVVDPASTLPDEPFDVAAATTLRGGNGQPPAIEPLTNSTVNKVRQLTLNEVMGPAGPLAALVNNTKWDGKRPPALGGGPVNGGSAPFDPDTYYTEFPQEGETELWEIVNLTADAHPIHLHLVQFQLLNRQKFNVNKYSGVYNAVFPGGVYIEEYGPPLAYDTGVTHSVYTNLNILGGNPDVGALRRTKPLYLQGPAMPPLPQEAGWKDTVIMYPGEVTRIMVRWAPTDLPANTLPANAYFPFDPNGGHGYVWHCHIIDHEDNEMMRPDAVTSIAVSSGTATAGGADLVDSGADFQNAGVVPMMTVKNLTTGSMGRITNVVDATTLQTTITWTVGDAYEVGPPRDFIKGVDY